MVNIQMTLLSALWQLQQQKSGVQQKGPSSGNLAETASEKQQGAASDNAYNSHVAVSDFHFDRL